MFLDCGEKLGNLERTQVNGGEHEGHSVNPIKPNYFQRINCILKNWPEKLAGCSILSFLAITFLVILSHTSDLQDF